MSLFSHASAFSREHPLLDLRKLQLVLPISRVLLTIWLRGLELNVGIVELCSHFACKEKGSGNSNGTDGVQLICIKENLSLQGLWLVVSAESVSSDAMDNISSRKQDTNQAEVLEIVRHLVRYPDRVARHRSYC